MTLRSSRAALSRALPLALITLLVLGCEVGESLVGEPGTKDGGARALDGSVGGGGANGRGEDRGADRADASAVDASRADEGERDAGSSLGGADAGAPGVTTNGNPFAGAQFYVNPSYAEKVDSSIALAPELRSRLEALKQISSAVWLDRIAMVASLKTHLDGARAQATQVGKPVVSVFVVYDLPNRDCAALASNGELSLAANGAERYRTEFIDPIAAELAQRPNQRIVLIIEPDSLGNLATNLGVPKCAASAQAYTELVAYAIRKLSMPHVSLYLDAAHSGWLGWPDNRAKIARVFREVLELAGGADKIRGFATNVANYTVLSAAGERYDYQSNPCRDELTYVQALAASLRDEGLGDKRFIIDTSRNGRGGIRGQWGAWCNVRGAGIGERPRADPAQGLDAYYWVKPPGESDGTTDASSPRFDATCAGPDATPGAPEAGAWFHGYLLDLVRNAAPGL